MTIVGGLLGVSLVVLYFGVIIFLITLLWRITIAFEKTARHLLEIARDVKELSHRSGDEEE
jgi:hypothetical protein